MRTRWITLGWGTRHGANVRQVPNKIWLRMGQWWIESSRRVPIGYGMHEMELPGQALLIVSRLDRRNEDISRINRASAKDIIKLLWLLSNVWLSCSVVSGWICHIIWFILLQMVQTQFSKLDISCHWGWNLSYMAYATCEWSCQTNCGMEKGLLQITWAEQEYSSQLIWIVSQ